MFKVELEFDTSLPKETVNKYCKETDKIFTSEGVIVAEKSFGKRCYTDETDNACMNIGAALFGLRKNAKLCRVLKSCYYYEGTDCEDLMEIFFCDR